MPAIEFRRGNGFWDESTSSRCLLDRLSSDDIGPIGRSAALWQHWLGQVTLGGVFGFLYGMLTLAEVMSWK